jgi:tRNA uridine 5-carboxymethylaminomethyl modification enzyme
MASLQGPAVWALRAQTDKLEYSTVMRRVLEGTPNLFMREGMAVDLDLGPNDEVHGRGLQGRDDSLLKLDQVNTPLLITMVPGLLLMAHCTRVQVRGVRTFFGITFRCRAAVITTGTFMNGRIWVGRQSMPAGRSKSICRTCCYEWRFTGILVAEHAVIMCWVPQPGHFSV